MAIGEPLRQDLRYAWRLMTRSRAFTLAIVLTLGLGVGANTAIFTLVNAVLLESLPVDDPDRLVVLEWVTPRGDARSFSYPLYERLRDEVPAFAGVFAARNDTTTVPLRQERAAADTTADVQLVSGEYFDVLGARPLVGRTFTREVNRTPAQDDAAPAVLSYTFWQRHFRGEANVIGRTITLKDLHFTIVGVMRPEFFGELVGRAPDVWVPLALQPRFDRGTSYVEDPRVGWLNVMARLAPGISPEQARAALDVEIARLNGVPTELGTAMRHVARIEVREGARGLSDVRERFSRSLLILTAVVGLVLLITCANVSNLLLSRATVRQREVAVRLAIGAGRARLVRQFLTESLLLAAGGAALGLLIAWWGSHVLVLLVSTDTSPIAIDVTPDARILAFTLLVSLAAAILFGLAPALTASRLDVTSALVLRSTARGRSRIQPVLVIAQVALSLVLLTGAALFVRTLHNLRTLDLGFASDTIVQAHINPAASGYTWAEVPDLSARILDRLSATHGVLAASVAGAGFGTGMSATCCIAVEGFAKPGRYVIAARTADGASAQVTVTASTWRAAGARMPPGVARARNIIFLLGDGMGIAHRTAARIVSRGIADGKAKAPLAMDTLEATGQVMTFALNAAITDSAPGMSSYSTGQKGNNNTEGVFPDNTADVFDNPRVEYIGELLKRVRGAGFNVGIVTSADVTDATPGANAVHTSDRNAGPRIAERFFDERTRNGVAVLLGGGRRQFLPTGTPDSNRRDARDLIGAFTGDGYRYLSTRTELTALLAAKAPPAKLLGLFHTTHLNVAFDRVGAGRYSDELALLKHAAVRDQPALDEMARLALRSLSAHSPAGFYLLIEGASIDKQAHASDAERTVWDTIEFDNAVRVALDFADRTNTDRDPTNDTLVIVTADHETGGLGIIGVGNERFAPKTYGSAVRDYAAVFRFAPAQTLNFIPNYQPDVQGFPIDPDPSRKLLLGWAGGADRYENWISNRLMLDSSITEPIKGDETHRHTVANPARDGNAPASDNKTITGERIAGFFVPGTIENADHNCLDTPACPDDISPEPHIIGGHTASDVLLSASGPGAIQFTGTYDNTDVFLKMLKSAAGTYDPRLRRRTAR